MIVRRVLPCLRQVSSSSGNVRRQIAQYGRVQRRYSSASAGPSASASASVSSTAAPIASITSELDRLSPRFNVPADSIEILRTPAEFYSALKSKILNAKRRIYLSTLYVGKSEHELVCRFRFIINVSIYSLKTRLPPFTMHSRQTPTSRSPSRPMPYAEREKPQTRRVPVSLRLSSVTSVQIESRFACIILPTSLESERPLYPNASTKAGVCSI